MGFLSKLFVRIIRVPSARRHRICTDISEMIEIGTVLQDRFLIEEQIGVGGMGAVYRAVDQKFGTAVAIKETFYRDKDLAEAFEREARLLNGLHHPLFPHVSDHFTEGEGHFLVMEFIEGEDLSHVLRRGERIPFETVLKWTFDMLDGLDYLHSQEPPIIHRDIKPGNLKLTSRGNIVLLDFGMAKETSGNTQGMRSVFGYSRRYSPLEQIEGAGTDERSDIFSLGATVFHLMAGTPPVDVLRRASAIVAGNPDPIQLASTLNPEVPDRVAKIIETALSLSPDKRFVSARAMWSALQSAVDTGKAKPSFIRIQEEQAQPDSTAGFPAMSCETRVDADRSVSVFRSVAEDEDDPIAALIAQRVAEMKAADNNKIAFAADPPAHIEVPIITEPELTPADVQELGVIDEPESREVLTSLPEESGSSRPQGYRMIGFLGVPLLLMVLGFAGYLMTRSGGDAEILVDEAAETSVPVNRSATPEASSQLPVEDRVVQDSPTVAVGQPAAESVPDLAGSSKGTAQSDDPQRSGSGVAERTVSGRTEATERAEVPRTRRQDQSQVRNSDRNSRSIRPRMVNEEEFEQPPVSSIESIMTGIPADRPRRKRSWEVLEEDELRRERRIRRINRRNRQRDQLF